MSLVNPADGQNLSSTTYNIGNPVLSDIWVDPTNGSDSNSGTSRESALRTISAAWNMIPIESVLSTTGYRIQLVAGDYPEDTLPNYWERRIGTASFPIIIQAADGRGTARLLGDMNVYRVSYLYLIDFDIAPNPAGDAFHCELCDHILMRGMELDGGPNDESQEAIKINQSQYIYLEDSDIHSSYENPVDFVATHYGHIVRNRIHDGGDWCIYLKGGSAGFLVEGNTIYDCGTGGFSAGQGSGFEYMVSPWLHYEAYDIKFINNIVHDTEGAGFGVNGGYNILLAHNSLYRVGSRSHGIEVTFGLRSCDGDGVRCAANNAAGGWGPVIAGEGDYPIPNRNVFVLNNVLYNPPGFRSEWQHFFLPGARTPVSGSNIPSPATVDTNLVIRGNAIWNGPADLPIGIEEGSSACASANPTCNLAQIQADNLINAVAPVYANAEGGDFTLTNEEALRPYSVYPLPDFPGGDREPTPLAPQGELDNTVSRDFNNQSRLNQTAPGALSSLLIARESADYYFPWNSFLSMTNILELLNSGTSPVTATITVWQNSGQALHQQRIRLNPNTQRDIILNDMPNAQINAYGLVTVDTDGRELMGRLSFYRASAEPGQFDFAFAFPSEPPQTGTSAALSNLSLPSGVQTTGDTLYNWLSIVNIDPDHERRFTIEKYDSLGVLSETVTTTVPPFGRRDVWGGVNNSSDTQQLEAHGLCRVLPQHSSSPYYAFMTRYAADTSGQVFSMAFPFLAQGAQTVEKNTPVSTAGGGINILELINLSDSTITVPVVFYNSRGVEIGLGGVPTTAPFSYELPPRTQIELNVQDWLGGNATGLAYTGGVSGASLGVNSVFYFPGNNSSGVAAMYATGNISGCGDVSGTFNLYLGMYNWLKLINPTSGVETANLDVYPFGGGVTSRSVRVPANGALDLGLHEGDTYGTSPNTYGVIKLRNSSLCASIVRIKPDGRGDFDFIFPTTLH